MTYKQRWQVISVNKAKRQDNIISQAAMKTWRGTVRKYLPSINILGDVDIIYRRKRPSQWWRRRKIRRTNRLMAGRKKRTRICSELKAWMAVNVACHHGWKASKVFMRHIYIEERRKQAEEIMEGVAAHGGGHLSANAASAQLASCNVYLSIFSQLTVSVRNKKEI